MAKVLLLTTFTLKYFKQNHRKIIVKTIQQCNCKI